MTDIKNIFNEFYSPLCNYAVKIVKDSVIAEDIVQSLFIQLWETNKLVTIEKPERFLLRSTKFKCIDYLRKNNSSTKVFASQESWDQITSTVDLNEEDIEPLLHYFASKLPRKTREVFLLSRTSGLTYKEIAKDRGIAVKTVETHMSKALKIMRKLLKDHDFFTLLVLLEFMDL
ncbi:RNA polymerase sigma-70 factor [Tenacibaculum sp. C7A-26P2]|uniref:RNA polymerase sigma-70 factor n=1 Tax=Tenacibaculum sp. C7A-26P2 TaxID=3447504 RepID=UPI003F85798D